MTAPLKGGVSEAAKAKAWEMLPFGEDWRDKRETVAAFIQQVSDAAKEASAQEAMPASRTYLLSVLAPFILPEPVDPLASEATKFAESWAPEMVTPYPPARLERLEVMALAALRRGMELAKEEQS